MEKREALTERTELLYLTWFMFCDRGDSVPGLNSWRYPVHCYLWSSIAINCEPESICSNHICLTPYCSYGSCSSRKWRLTTVVKLADASLKASCPAQFDMSRSRCLNGSNDGDSVLNYYQALTAQLCAAQFW